MASNTDNNHKNEVSKWVREALFEKENFKKIDVALAGSSEKGDGYIGDIAFVEVTALTNNDETKEFKLVLKYGKQDEGLREKMPVRFTFEREIFVYSTAVPKFHRFEEKRNVKVLDTFMTKCFGTLLYETQEVLLLQNLKTIGYELHNRFQTLDINHLKLTFENYGKWHGLSIAHRDQAPEEYNGLFGDLESVLLRFGPLMQASVDKTEEALHAILETSKEVELLDMLRRRFPDGFYSGFNDLLKGKEANNVLLHGDCWNNNMMFHYDDPDKTQPDAVKFLDFQMSNLGSPVNDLSYHLYSTASEKELLQFKDILRAYHSSLSKTIQSLGSDPEKLFPYTELVRQWKKYSSYGLVMGVVVLPIALSEKEDALDIQELVGDEVGDMVKKVMEKNYEGFSSRVIAGVRHFLQFDDYY